MIFLGPATLQWLYLEVLDSMRCTGSEDANLLWLHNQLLELFLAVLQHEQQSGLELFYTLSTVLSLIAILYSYHVLSQDNRVFSCIELLGSLLLSILTSCGTGSITSITSFHFKDLQRRSRLETVLETVSVLTSRRDRDRGVSRPVLSLTKPQDETKTRQTSLVSDRLETVSVLFFLFLGDTGNEPFARPRTKSREGGK
ncbi:hypothetical protein PROFUN_16634 [Planoprotostelium fungivorum]|uniref:Uncharacterized protein n=1 Tax=Planoprotostelium fungivorum TaxID=1890364 RepID=A0A2P6MP34_9EUKA|nr:hypothetical protein PROFUN_16634 [Planoprotostelium fungivorum]